LKTDSGSPVNEFLSWGGLGTLTQTIYHSVFFLGFFSKGDVSLRTGAPPHLQWLSFPSLVAAVLITPKGAESPGSGRIAVVGALVFSPSEAV